MKSFLLAFILPFFPLLCSSQDIVITGVSGNQVFEQYALLTTNVTVKNEGIVGTASFSIKGLLSVDNVISNDDYELSINTWITLAAGESKTVELKGYLVPGPSLGNYNLIVQADEYNSVTETNEANNISIASAYSIVPSNIDLVFQSCTLNHSTTSQFTELDVQYTVVNTGTTLLSQRVWTSFYLSTDETLSGDDVLLEDWGAHPSSNQFTTHTSLPIPGKPAGNYFILAITDHITITNESITERDETNNLVALPLTISAADIDLEMTQFANLQYLDGTYTFNVTIRNNGTTPVYIDGDDFSLTADYMELPGYISMIGEKIEPGQSRYFSYVSLYSYNPGGTVNTYTLHVNKSRAIPEVNYYNNSLDLGNIPTPGNPVVTLTNASWLGTYNQTDTELLLSATFFNSGDSYHVYEGVTIKITNSTGQVVHTTYDYFIDSYFENGTSATQQFTLNLANSLSAGNYNMSITNYRNSVNIPLTILQPEYTLSGTIQDDSGTPITNGKLFLYQKKDNGSIFFINQIENTVSNNFSFRLDQRDYTLYFIPDRTAFPDYLPTVFGKTLMLEETSFFHLRDDLTVVMNVLKVTPPAVGSSFINGTITEGSPGGRIQTAESFTIILLNEQGDPLAITTTDEDGYFIFENLAPGAYQLAVTSNPDQPIADQPYAVDISTANARVELTHSAAGISGSTERVLYEQTISFNEIASKTYGDEPFQLEGTSSSGLMVSFISSDTEIAVIDGMQVNILQAGIVTITAMQEGNESYQASDATRELVIHKASQIIDFEAITDKNSDETSFELSALSSSGLDVSFMSSNTSLVLIEMNTAYILKQGEVTITALQEGNENYESAVPVARTFTANMVLGAEDLTSKVRVYPNPSSDIIKFDSEVVISEVSLLHSSGRREDVLLQENEFNIQHLAAGVYVLRFIEGGIRHHVKVVKN